MCGLKMFLLLGCCIIAGITAEAPPLTRYGLKGSAVCLHVGNPHKTQNLRVTWSINNNMIVNNGNFILTYAEKMDYNRENHSLCIKELNEADSSIYKATVTNDVKNTISDVYHRLIVQEAVSQPVIGIKVQYSNLTAEHCNISVNCSVRDTWALYVCDEICCRTSQSLVTAVNITVSRDNGTVVCHGNNHVSVGNASRNLQRICSSKTSTKHPDTLPVYQVVIIICVVLLLLPLVCVSIGYLARRLNRLSAGYANQENPPSIVNIASVPSGQDAASSSRQEAQHNHTGDQSSSSNDENIYENVEDPRRLNVNDTTVKPENVAETRLPTKAETVYCSLQLPTGTDSLNKDIKTTEETREGTDTSETDPGSEHNKVQNDARHQSMVNMNVVPEQREAPEQTSESLYATVQPVRQSNRSSPRQGK